MHVVHSLTVPRQDLGRPDDYEQANIDFEQMRSEFLPED